MSDKRDLDIAEITRIVSRRGMPGERFPPGQPHRREVGQDRGAVGVENPGTGPVEPQQQHDVEDDQRNRAGCQKPPQRDTARPRPSPAMTSDGSQG